MAWFDITTSAMGEEVYTCRHRGCTTPPYIFRSTTTFATHLRNQHQVDCQTMSPVQHPHLLRSELRSAVNVIASVLPSSIPVQSMSLSSFSPSLPPPPALLSPASSQASDDRYRAESPSSHSIFSSSSSSSLMTAASSRSVTQRTIYSSLHAANNPLVPPLQAKLFARLGLAHRMADAEEMDEFLMAFRFSTLKPLRRQAVKDAQSHLAATLRVEVINKLKSYSTASPISIAIDGWTNTRHHKVTNILCLCGGQAYYWCSIVNRYDKNTAAWLCKPIADAIAELSDHGIRITALVADNEAVNGKLYKLLKPKFPFLLLSSCAAHTIQLCVNKALKEDGIYNVMMTIEGIVKQFRKGKRSKFLRLKLANVQREVVGEARIKPLVIPCDTRWSSHRAAGVRLLELQSFVVLCDLPKPPAESFWPQLKELINFLEPFQRSTDIIQADSSTLYSVYQQFYSLLAYVDAVPSTSTFFLQ
jgi:hypothetical protein